MGIYEYIFILVNAALIMLFFFLGVKKWKIVRDIVGSDSIQGTIVASSYPAKSNPIKSFDVQYEYLVRGVSYKGKVPHQQVTDHSRYVDNHPIGSELKVFYSKRDPSFSMTLKPTFLETVFKVFTPYIIIWAVVNYVFIYLEE